jgi:hypothetical protein
LWIRPDAPRWVGLEALTMEVIPPPRVVSNSFAPARRLTIRFPLNQPHRGCLLSRSDHIRVGNDSTVLCTQVQRKERQVRRHAIGYEYELVVRRTNEG